MSMHKDHVWVTTLACNWISKKLREWNIYIYSVMINDNYIQEKEYWVLICLDKFLVAENSEVRLCSMEAVGRLL